MTPLPLPGPISTPVNGRTPDTPSGKCPARSKNDEPGKWTTGPVDRKRTLVLCFDGTGESFDVDVSPLGPIILEHD